MAKEIKISIKSGFDPSGVADASRSIARLRQNLLTSNAELSAAIHNRAAEVAVDYSAAADKGVAHTLLSAKEIEAAWARAMGKIPTEAVKGFGRLGSIAKGALSGAGIYFKSLGAEFMRGGIWGVAANVAVKAFMWGWGKIKEGAEEAAKKAKQAFEDSLSSVKSNVSSAAESFAAMSSSIDTAISKFDTMTNKVRELTKAEIELAKQQAIANGMDASAANAAAADLAAQVDTEAEEARLNNEIKLNQKRVDEAKKTEQEITAQIEAANKTRADAEAKYQAEREKYIKANSKTSTFQGTQYGGVWIESYDNSAERREKEGKAFDESEEGRKAREDVTKADENIKNAEKEREKIKAAADKASAAIENANTAIATLETKREARELAAQNELTAKVKEEQKKKDEAAKVAAEKEAEAKRKLAEKTAAEQMRLDREAAAARERQAQKELDQKIKNHQKLIAAENKAEGDARAAQSKAESKLQQAWGWYRNKDSMRAQLEEEKADAAAQKQFEKDFAKLKDKRRDWRTAENLSVDDEAVRRVGLAREEKAAADKHLAEIEKNTADLAKKLDELLQVKG